MIDFLSLKMFPAASLAMKDSSFYNKAGVYRHYKGNYYLLLFVSQHTETQEELVIYQSLYGDFGIWARPLEMFFSTIEYEGKTQPRFYKVAESDEAATFIKK
jgi:hypothetical protein